MPRSLIEFDMNRKFYLKRGRKANLRAAKTADRCGIVEYRDEQAYFQFFGRSGDDASGGA